MAQHRRVELQPAVEIRSEAQRGIDVAGQRVEAELGACHQVERSRPNGLRAPHVVGHRMRRVIRSDGARRL